MKKYRFIENNAQASLWTFPEGTTLWMVDFSEEDQRNVARRIWSRAHLSLFREKMKSNSVFFFVEVGE